MNKIKYITAVLFIAAFFSTQCIAADADKIKASFRMQQSQDQCLELLKDCFPLKDQEKNSCLKEASENIFCKGSKLSALTDKRWSYSALQTDNKLTDKSCLDNFDNLFSASIIRGEISAEEIKELTGNLNNCKRPSPIELNRQ